MIYFVELGLDYTPRCCMESTYQEVRTISDHKNREEDIIPKDRVTRSCYRLWVMATDEHIAQKKAYYQAQRLD